MDLKKKKIKVIFNYIASSRVGNLPGASLLPMSFSGLSTYTSTKDSPPAPTPLKSIETQARKI